MWTERVDTSSGRGQLLVAVPVRTLVELCDPLYADPWGVGPIDPGRVEAALSAGRVRADNPCWCRETELTAGVAAHVERIAWLVRHGWDSWVDPIQVEVDQHGGVSVNDGNHRLYVLAFLSAGGSVVIELSGFVDVAEGLFGVVIP